MSGWLLLPATLLAFTVTACSALAEPISSDNDVTIDAFAENYEGLIDTVFGSFAERLRSTFIRKTFNAIDGAIVSNNQDKIFVSIGSFNLDYWKQEGIEGPKENLGRLFDAHTGKLLLQGFPHKEMIDSVAFSSDDSKLLISSHDITSIENPRRIGNEISKIQLFDVTTGAELIPAISDDDYIRSARFSHDDSKILAAFADRRVRLYDAGSGEELDDPIVRATLKCWTSIAVFSRDDSRIATDSHCPKRLRLFDVTSGEELIEPVNNGDFDIRNIVFNPDDRLILTGNEKYGRRKCCEHGLVRLLDAATGGEVIEAIPHEHPVKGISFSDNGRRFFTLSGPGYERFNVSKGPTILRLFDTDTGLEVSHQTYDRGPIRDVVLGEDGHQVRLVSEHSNGILRVQNEEIFPLRK